MTSSSSASRVSVSSGRPSCLLRDVSAATTVAGSCLRLTEHDRLGEIDARWIGNLVVGRVVGRVVDRVTSIPNVGESSNRSHLDLWEVGVQIAADHPVFGTGPDTYVLLFAEYRDDVLTPERAAIMSKFRPESPHNVYISTAAGSGVPSLLAYLLIIGGSLAATLKAARREIPRPVRLALAGFAGGAVIHLVTDGFMTGEPASAAVFWILLGAAAGLAERQIPSASSVPAR